MCLFSLVKLLKDQTHVFAVATVSTDAADAAVHHLDATQHQLQDAHAQQDGEQDHVPQDDIFGEDAQGPQLLVHQVAGVSSGQQKKTEDK